MAQSVRITHPRKTGVWPNGEPKSVRDAYDKQQAEKGQKDGKAGRKAAAAPAAGGGARTKAPPASPRKKKKRSGRRR